MQATCAIIHIDNFSQNFQVVRERVGQNRKICVPIKADAYGHGSLRIAQAAFEAGAYCVAVASVGEAAELRSGGISGPIMLLSQPLFEEIPGILEYSLIPLVSDSDFIKIIRLYSILQSTI